MTLHVGTYTGGASKGIYRLDFDPETGALGEPVLAAEALNPAFVVWHPRLPVLYTASETDTGPQRQGLVIAFAADAAGGLTKLNEQPSGGAAPCYVSADPSGARVFVANYHGGSVAALPIDADGRLRPASSVARHSGSSVHPVRQRKPYAHSIVPAPSAPVAPAVVPVAPAAALGASDAPAASAATSTSIASSPSSALDAPSASSTPAASATAGTPAAPSASSVPSEPSEPSASSASSASFVLAADLGIDRVIVYRIDDATGTLTPHDDDTAATAAAPGAGPRHLAFTPAGDTLFVMNELNSTIAAYAWDAARGTLDRRGAPVSTLPDEFSGENITAEVAVHPSGKFLYGSNRGHDSIAIFRIGAGDDRRLTRVGFHPTGGKTPRHFAIDPTGAFLIAANQDSDSLVVFRIDTGTGLLSDTVARASIPSPACVRFRSPASLT